MKQMDAQVAKMTDSKDAEVSEDASKSVGGGHEEKRYGWVH